MGETGCPFNLSIKVMQGSNPLRSLLLHQHKTWIDSSHILADKQTDFKTVIKSTKLNLIKTKSTNNQSRCYPTGGDFQSKAICYLGKVGF